MNYIIGGRECLVSDNSMFPGFWDVCQRVKRDGTMEADETKDLLGGPAKSKPPMLPESLRFHVQEKRVTFARASVGLILRFPWKTRADGTHEVPEPSFDDIVRLLSKKKEQGAVQGGGLRDEKSSEGQQQESAWSLSALLARLSLS